MCGASPGALLLRVCVLVLCVVLCVGGVVFVVLWFVFVFVCMLLFELVLELVYVVVDVVCGCASVRLVCDDALVRGARLHHRERVLIFG